MSRLTSSATAADARMRSTSQADLTARWRTMVRPTSSNAAPGKSFSRRRKCATGRTSSSSPSRAGGAPYRSAMRRGRSLGDGELHDRAERRLQAGALGDLAHEQRRLALGRHVQVRLLDRAGVVEEVGVLLEEGGVEAEGREAGLQAGDAARQLRRRRQRRARLYQLRSLSLRHAAVSP